MKYVNEAFEESESETEHEPPPTYSPIPKEGEFVYARSPMSEEGAVGGFSEQPETPGVCSCDKTSIIRSRPRSRSPRSPEVPTKDTMLPSGNQNSQDLMFNDNFDDKAIQNLPKDPPPYI